jgi:hypothetical protein
MMAIRRLSFMQYGAIASPERAFALILRARLRLQPWLGR